jgi:hypothetical protein
LALGKFGLLVRSAAPRKGKGGEKAKWKGKRKKAIYMGEKHGLEEEKKDTKPTEIDREKKSI